MLVHVHYWASDGMQVDVFVLVILFYSSEPSSPPVGVQVRADSSESITVFWKEPEITNGVIRNYSVLCFHTESGENIINETVPVAQPVSQFFLEPSSTYSCQVIAYNDHGPSLAQQAVGTTLPVTSENVDCHNFLIIITLCYFLV